MVETSDYYVYVYIDPRDFTEFYYGKGRGQRRYAHLEGNEEPDNEKARIIQDIQDTDLDPIIRVIAKDLTEQEAFLIETTLIWKLGRSLTNVRVGAFSEKFRPPKTLHEELYEFDYQNGIYFFNVGEGETRCWADCKRYGFLSAGGSQYWSSQTRSFLVGDIVVAYLSKKGYVGIGKVIGLAVNARDLVVDGRRLAEVDLERPQLLDSADDPDKAEWAVSVEWDEAVDAHEAKWIKGQGLFTPRQAKASLQHQEETLAFLATEFGIDPYDLLR